MSDSNTTSVQLDFSHTEKEYLAAVRLYVWRSGELFARVCITYLFLAGIVLMLPILFEFLIPYWALVILLVIGGVGWYHGFVIDLPRRHFRANPKFREEYHLRFSDAGIDYKSTHASGSFDWTFYNSVIEDDSFYLLLYGKDLHSISVIPKRAFRDREQEAAFRELLRRHVDHTFKLEDGDQEKENILQRAWNHPTGVSARTRRVFGMNRGSERSQTFSLFVVRRRSSFRTR